ncbi:MAG: LysM peptidoglycan-binding domain-containing protein [Ignavibacteriales bacterium]|nr:LysM peptidoglycan-binding domain-containing protein [Ignavibacteriales bacterium]MCB9258870.1 LysM peptidoglycan-binding domain-containing protein [Ignavibacteriales bacterium]
MSLTMKYGPVLDVCNRFNMKDADVSEREEGYLKVYGIVHTQYEKNKIWDKIKEVGGQSPTDIKADIRVEQKDYYHKHTVVSGDTLGKISKEYLGEAGKYMEIFNANKDQLSNPDLIKVGQVLTIPFVD